MTSSPAPPELSSELYIWSDTDPLVKEQVAISGWGQDGYPQDELMLDAKDMRLLSLVDQDKTLNEIAATEGVSRTIAYARFHVSFGKIDALEAAKNGTHFLEVDVDAQRVILLNSLFGTKWTARAITAISYLPEIIIQNSRELDKIFSKGWKHWPQLALMTQATRNERMALYDSEYGPNWRHNPELLELNPQTVKERTQIYDQWLGREWRERPARLKLPPKTVISSARALATIGITQDNVGPSVYAGLTGTSLGNKKEKIAMIRREILGHKEVHIFSKKRRLAENVNARGRRTEQAKALEAEEIEEFQQFLPKLGPHRLLGSADSIRRWASRAGQYKKGV